VPHERRDALWSAVLAVLPEQGFPIERADETKGVVASSPVEISAQEAGIAVGGGLGTRRVFRRLADVRLAPSEGGIGAYCRVLIQEQATESYRLFRRAPGLSDVPDDTAIDRDAATTGEQNTVWQTVRRDKLREYRLLEEIVTRATTP
jgi:hypothetical protein